MGSGALVTGVSVPILGRLLKADSGDHCCDAKSRGGGLHAWCLQGAKVLLGGQSIDLERRSRKTLVENVVLGQDVI